MRNLSIRAALLTASMVTSSAIMLGASPADAATATQGRDYGSVKHGRPYDWMEACDIERDGHGVYLEYWTRDGSHSTVWDGNGSKPGCGNGRLYEPDDVTRFRVCEDNDGDTVACTGVVKP